MSDERNLPSDPPADDPELPDAEDQIDEPDDDLDEPDLREESEDSEPEPQVAPRRRGSETVTALRSRAQQAEARTVDLQRRLAALEGRQNLPDPRVQQQAAQEEENRFYDSLEMMSPREQAKAISDRLQRQNAMALAASEIRGFDRSDKANYAAEMARSKFARDKEQEVEAGLAQMRQQGLYQMSRMDVLDFLAGREQRLRRERDTQQQRRTGARNVARETVRAASGRGEGSAGGRRQSQDDADAALLRGITVGDVVGM